MRRPFIAPILIACLALAAAGCGSSSSTSTGSTAGAAPTTEAGTSTPSTETTTTQPGGQGGSSQGSSTGGSSSADNSIQTYGSAATGADKTALAGAAFSFFRALAAGDYTKVCAGLLSADRQQFQAVKIKNGQGGCATDLKRLVPPTAAAEARKAASGTLSSVRIKGDTAFVLFRPAGGKPSYFVMKREGGSWKALSVAPGTPLEIPTPQGQ